MNKFFVLSGLKCGALMVPVFTGAGLVKHPTNKQIEALSAIIRI